MLGRLRVQQKLTLLLLLPLIAVILGSTPYVVTRVDAALAATSTVDVAERARRVAALVQDMQEERLLALSYLVTDSAGRDAVRVAVAATSDRVDQVAAKLRSSDDTDRELLLALGKLRRLDFVRKSVFDRTGKPVDVDQAYHDLVMKLVSALGLTQQTRADATGIRQLATFDSLLRINEDITRIGAALVIGTTDSQNASKVIAEALLLVEADIVRFRSQADGNQSEMLNLVVQGQTAQRINEYARQISSGGLWVAPTKALTAAETALTLTQLLQERIARDIAVQAGGRADDARLSAGLVIGFGLLLVLVVIVLSAAMSRAIARPLRRLTFAATSVADLARTELVRVADSEVEQSRPPKLVAVQATTTDEIGDLAKAFNRVQATAALLMEQQVASRRNTAVMFANIARRTRSLVSRQLTFIDDLERTERNEKVLAKLYRLDHLTTRLHRSADSLLVVSGIREEDRIVEPAPLADVIRSAIAEIEGYQNVEVGTICQATIAPQLVPDLRLVLAELLENASAFSPPTAKVGVRARLDRDIEIVIVDHGIGMSDEKLEEENRRLVERERLDVAPTSVLGLFVVGRLARRHGLRVRLRRGKDQGIVVDIRVPPALFSVDTRQMATDSRGAQLELPRHPDPMATRELPAVPVLPMVPGSFEWFGGAETLLAGPSALPAGPAPQPQSVPQPPPAPRAPIAPPAPPMSRAPVAPPVPRAPMAPPAPPVSRAPVAPPAPPVSRAPVAPPAPPVSRPPVAPPAPPVPPASFASPAPSRPGPGPDQGQADDLVRRTPGDGLQYFGIEPPRQYSQQPPPLRDAEAERAQLEAFTRGTADADAAPPSPYPPPPASYPQPVVPAPASYPVPTVEPVVPAPASYPPPAASYPPPSVPAPASSSYPPAPASSYPPAPASSYPPPVAAPAVPAAAASPPAVPAPISRGGLTRRVPGAHLSAALKTPQPTSTSKPVTRDAGAERDALHSFLDGLARAESITTEPRRTVEPDDPEK